MAVSLHTDPSACAPAAHTLRSIFAAASSVWSAPLRAEVADTAGVTAAEQAGEGDEQEEHGEGHHLDPEGQPPAIHVPGSSRMQRRPHGGTRTVGILPIPPSARPSSQEQDNQDGERETS